MSLQKNEIMVDCKRCKFASSNDAGSFVVTVPLQDLKTGGCQTAILRCAVSADHHDIEFQGWEDELNSSASFSADLPTRMASVLSYVARIRICGNAKLCPSEVVQAVQRFSSE